MAWRQQRVLTAARAVGHDSNTTLRLRSRRVTREDQARSAASPSCASSTGTYDTKGSSRNNALLAVITLGEGWHNNHHHCMSSARQGFLCWELDVSYAVLKALSWLRIVWDVRAPRLH